MKRRVIRYDPKNDFYSVLGVPANANADQVQQAFRQKAKEVHPDHNPERVAWATEQFRRLNEAYAVLSDAARRWEYDRQRRQTHPTAYVADSAWWTQPQHPAPERETPRRTPERMEGDEFWAWYRTVKPQYTRYNNPYRDAMQNLFFSPYRYVLTILGLVFLANVVFISLAQQNGLMQRERRREQTAVALAFAPTQTYAAALLARCPDPKARITLPSAEGRIDPTDLDVRGTADHPDFDHYQLYIFARENATHQPSILLANVRRPVREGLLVENADVSGLGAARYTLRLTVFLKSGGNLPPCEVDIQR